MVTALLKDRQDGTVRWYHDQIVSNTDSVHDPAARVMDTAALPWQLKGAGTQGKWLPLNTSSLYADWSSVLFFNHCLNESENSPPNLHYSDNNNNNNNKT